MYMHLTPTLRRLRQEDFEFKVSLGYPAKAYLQKWGGDWGEQVKNEEKRVRQGGRIMRWARTALH